MSEPVIRPGDEIGHSYAERWTVYFVAPDGTAYGDVQTGSAKYTKVQSRSRRPETARDRDHVLYLARLAVEEYEEALAAARANLAAARANLAALLAADDASGEVAPDSDPISYDASVDAYYLRLPLLAVPARPDGRIGNTEHHVGDLHFILDHNEDGTVRGVEILA